MDVYEPVLPYQKYVQTILNKSGTYSFIKLSFAAEIFKSNIIYTITLGI